MDIIQRDEVESFTTADGSTIRELMAHRNASIQNQSLAEATVSPGQSTQPHYHPKSEEIYYILQGKGIMTIESEQREVLPGDAIAILPGKKHRIENHGTVLLVFLCACSPAYEHEDTILLKEI
ncbi:MAG: cupin domain-containing protein [Verrucomicrobiota bacterium]